MERSYIAQTALRRVQQCIRLYHSPVQPLLLSRFAAHTATGPRMKIPTRNFCGSYWRLGKQPQCPENASYEPRQWDFDSVKCITNSPRENYLLIDVREPSELKATGTIPGSLNIPITSHPNAFHLPPESFRHLFGFEKPKANDSDAPELIFFCKAGVRGRAAAQLARNAGYLQVGDYAGSWIDWTTKGGPAEEFEGKGEIWERLQ